MVKSRSGVVVTHSGGREKKIITMFSRSSVSIDPSQRRSMRDIIEQQRAVVERKE